MLSRMEYSFSAIGSAVGLGGLFGGVSGLLTGLKETQNLSGKIRYSQYDSFNKPFQLKKMFKYLFLGWLISQLREDLCQHNHLDV